MRNTRQATDLVNQPYNPPVALRGVRIDAHLRRIRGRRRRALFGLNQLEEAESNAREALRRKAEFPSVHLLLADIHGKKKEYESLVADLNDYLRLAPDGPASEWARNVRAAVERMIVESQSASAFAAPQS